MADSGGGIVGVLKQWTAGLIMLGALYLIGTHGSGISTALQAGGQFFSGTEGTVLKGGA
jgi:hypothetical protein